MTGFFHRLIVFCLRDFSLVIHFRKHSLLTLHIIFWMHQRRITGWILCDSCNCSTFRNVTVLDVLPKIEVCSSLHPIGAAAKIHHIEIRFQDLLSAVRFIQV